MPLLQPPSRPPPDTPGGVIVDILVSRLDPAVFQHGIDVMVPERVLSAVQQIRQLIEGQVSPLTEAENHRFDAFSRRFSQRADRFRNLMECSLMFGVPGKCSEFPANVRSSTSNRSRKLRTFHPPSGGGRAGSRKCFCRLDRHERGGRRCLAGPIRTETIWLSRKITATLLDTARQ